MIKVTNLNEEYYNYFKSLFTLALAKEFGVGANLPELFRDFTSIGASQGTYILIGTNEKPIGYSQYGVTINKTGWFSLFIDPKLQGKGYGKMAFAILTEKLFEGHKINNILHAVMIANCKMKSIIEEYGCRRIGEVRQRALTSSGADERITTSCIQYELTLEDYKAKAKSVIDDSRLSYGINDPVFLEFEKDRLITQNTIQMGPLEVRIADLVKDLVSVKIMDLGCGLGTLINGLAKKMSGVQFIGIDSEKEFVDIAKQSNFLPNVEFLNLNFFELTENIKDVDIFLMRIVAQHLGGTGLANFYELFKAHAKPTAKLLILDVDDRSWQFMPEISGFDLLLDSCNFNQKKFGGDRQIGAKCKDIAVQNGLLVEYFQVCPFDSHNIGLQNFAEIIAVLVQFKADSEYLVARDIEIVRENFHKWRNDSKSFGYGCLFLTQVGKYA